MQTEINLFFGFLIILMQIFFASTIVALSKYSFIKFDINPFFLLFLRHFFSFIFLLPLIVPIFLQSYKKHNFFVSFRNSFINIISLALWSFGYLGIPLSVATSFTFLIPVFTIFIAEFYLKERVTFIHKALLLVSVIGIILAIRPDVNAKLNIYYLITLISVILWSIGNIIRKLVFAKTDIKTWICYYYFWSVILTFVFAIPFFSKIPLNAIPIILLLSVLTAIVNFMLFKIYKIYQAYFVQSFDFLRLIFLTLADVFIFGNQVESFSFIGYSLIIVSSLAFLWKARNRVQVKRFITGKIECQDPEVY